jgi:hypothetical protein
MENPPVFISREECSMQRWYQAKQGTEQRTADSHIGEGIPKRCHQLLLDPMREERACPSAAAVEAAPECMPSFQCASRKQGGGFGKQLVVIGVMMFLMVANLAARAIVQHFGSYDVGDGVTDDGANEEVALCSLNCQRRLFSTAKDELKGSHAVERL